jgi:hypothetical protein
MENSDINCRCGVIWFGQILGRSQSRCSCCLYKYELSDILESTLQEFTAEQLPENCSDHDRP